MPYADPEDRRHYDRTYRTTAVVNTRVPRKVRVRLNARAAKRGMTLSEHLRDLAMRDLEASR